MENHHVEWVNVSNSTVSMAIFISYVKLPEYINHAGQRGLFLAIPRGKCVWRVSAWVLHILGRWDIDLPWRRGMLLVGFGRDPSEPSLVIRYDMLECCDDLKDSWNSDVKAIPYYCGTHPLLAIR